MHLYQEAYGFTQARLVVDVFEGWLGVVVLAVALAGLVRWGTWVPRFALVTGVLGLLGIAAINPDAWIAQQNIDRYEQTGKLDPDYLATLSADAVPDPDDAARAPALPGSRPPGSRPTTTGWSGTSAGPGPTGVSPSTNRFAGAGAGLPTLRDMSGPNTSYDPVEVTPLRADQVEEMRDQAFAAIAGAAGPGGPQAGPHRPHR